MQFAVQNDENNLNVQAESGVSYASASPYMCPYVFIYVFYVRV